MKTARGQQTLIDHVQELRVRVLSSVAVFAVGAAAGYVFRGTIIRWLEQPLHQPLYYTTPMGSFEFIVQVCGVAGLMVALPVLVFHLLRFIEPALPKQLRMRTLALVITASFGLAVGGAAFAYYVSMPAALHFFNSVGTKQLQPLISGDQYFRFVFAYLATFAVVFQLPLIFLVIDHITPLKPTKLRKWRKLVIVAAFAIALIIPSAPDPLSQLILALPIIALYEVAVALVWIRSRNRRPATQPVAATEATVPEPPAAMPPQPRPLRAAAYVSDLRSAHPSAHVLDLRSQ